MQARCEYSALTVPIDLSYVAVAVTYVAEIARQLGFTKDQRERISLAIEQTVTNVMEQVFEPDDKQAFEISCERVPEGLQVILKEKGMPFDPSRIPLFGSSAEAPKESRERPVSLLLKDLVDEFSIHNLGPEGQEIRLLIYLRDRSIEDYFQACELEQFQPPSETHRQTSEPADFHVHLIKTSEALEVARSAYKAYGYTYSNEHIYYPDRLMELNETGKLISATAVTPDGRLAGHCAISRSNSGFESAEIGQAVVKPEFRGQGCLLRLTEFLINEAKLRRIPGLYVRAVTSHTFSQRVTTRLGFKACAILLGYAPADVTFRGIKEELSQRETFVIQYRYLENLNLLKLYAPARHRDCIAEIYANLGIRPQFLPSDQPLTTVQQSKSILTTKSAASMPPGYASIEVMQYGNNVISEVRNTLKEFCLKQYDVIALYLDLLDPLTFHLVPQFEDMGFFFGGILPGSTVGEALVLQYLNNVAIDYDSIKLHTDVSREILAYVKSQDPNRR